MKRTWLLVGGGFLLFALLSLPGFGISVGQILPFLLVLLCPLLHFFVMRGHGGHGHVGREAPKEEPAPAPRALPASEGEETPGSPR